MSLGDRIATDPADEPMIRLPPLEVIETEILRLARNDAFLFAVLMVIPETLDDARKWALVALELAKQNARLTQSNIDLVQMQPPAPIIIRKNSDEL